MSSSSSFLLAHAALVAVPFFASGNTILSRMAFIGFGQDPPTECEVLQPLTLAVLRCVIAVIIFGLLRWRDGAQQQQESSDKISDAVSSKSTDAPPPPPGLLDHLHLYLLGFVGISLNFVFFLTGIQLTSGIVAAAWMTTVPAVTLVLGAVLGVENVTIVKGIGAILVIVGNVFTSHLWRIFTGDTATLSSPFSFYLGCLCMMLNTVCFSCYLVFSKPLTVPGKFTMLQFQWGVQLSGLIGLLLISLFPDEKIVSDQVLSMLSGKMCTFGVIAVLYAGIVQSSFVYVLLAFGIRGSGSPLTASLLNNLQPLLVALESVVLLGETFDKWQEIGGVVVLLGLAAGMYGNIRAATDAAQIEKDKKAAADAAAAAAAAAADAEEHHV